MMQPYLTITGTSYQTMHNLLAHIWNHQVKLHLVSYTDDKIPDKQALEEALTDADEQGEEPLEHDVVGHPELAPLGLQAPESSSN